MFFFVVSAIEAKQLLKVFTISYGLVIVSPLSRESTVGTWDATVFREIRDLFFIRVESKFLYFLYLVWNSSFSTGSFLLMKFVSNLFFTDIDFCKPKVIQGLDLNFSLYH